MIWSPLNAHFYLNLEIVTGTRRRSLSWTYFIYYDNSSGIINYRTITFQVHMETKWIRWEGFARVHCQLFEHNYYAPGNINMDWDDLFTPLSICSKNTSLSPSVCWYSSRVYLIVSVYPMPRYLSRYSISYLQLSGIIGSQQIIYLQIVQSLGCISHSMSLVAE